MCVSANTTDDGKRVETLERWVSELSKERDLHEFALSAVEEAMFGNNRDRSRDDLEARALDLRASESERDAIALREEELSRRLTAALQALELAAVLLSNDGYDSDPDYRQEWQVIVAARAVLEEEHDQEAPAQNAGAGGDQ